MPTSVVIAIAASEAMAVGAAYVGLMTGSAIAATIGGAVTAMAVSSTLNSAFSDSGDSASPQFEQQLRDNMVTVRQPITHWRYIYGRMRVGGAMTFAHESADDYFHMVITLAGHVCEEIESIQFNDEVVPLDINGEGTGKWAGYVLIHKSLGNEAGQPFPFLVAQSEGKWTDAHRQTGRTKIYVRLAPSVDLFPAGVPNITAIIKGKKVYDPRIATTVYSANPSLCQADFICDHHAGYAAVYAQEIDETQLIAAANIDDENVALAAGGTEDRYTLHGTFEVNDTPNGILGKMLTANAGKMRYIGGLFRLEPAVYVVPTITLTESDLRGVPSITPRLSGSDLANAVKGVYVSEGNLWQATDFPPVTNATYLSEDGAERSWRELDLPFTKSAATAQRIAKIELERIRQQISVEWPGKMTCYRLKAGDTVKITFAMLGWSEKIFEVIQSGLVFDGERMGCDLSLRETASTCFDWNSGEETTVDPAPDTNLPNPFTVGAVSGLTLSSGSAHLLETGTGSVISRIHATWNAMDDAFANDFDVEYKLSSATEWTPAPPVKDGVAVYISPVSDGNSYDVRVRAVNTIGVRSATWAYALNHVVIGKTEAPPVPDTFTAARMADGTRRYAWTLGTVPNDVRAGGGYQIRYKSGSTSDWDAMTALHTGLLLASPYESNELAAGTWTLAIKTVDSSGNPSATAKFITVTLDNPRLRNVLLSRMEHDLGWPGTLTDCFLYNGSLLAKSSTTIAGLAAAISSLAATIDNVGTNRSPIVYETPVIDIGSDVSFTPVLSVVGNGSATLTMKSGTTADGTVVGAYAALAAVTGKRYVQFKISMADTAPRIDTATLLLDAETQIDEFEDVNTATETATWFASTAAGHFKIGSSSGQLSSITSATIRAIQNVGSGWTWELINKTSTVNGQPAAEFKVYNSAGTLANAVIDVELKGPKS